jgi:hypothetical protein
MIPAGSRYEDGDRLSTETHLYDRYGNVRFDEQPVYQRPLIERRNTVYLSHTLPLPDLPEGEYPIREDEHLPLVAFKFLEDSQAWWRLAEVNPHVWYPLDVQIGDPVRIPGT